MTSSEIRRQFIHFMKERGHTYMPPSSLVPEADPSVLFTTAGMQQFKSYYTEPKLAASPRMCSIQPSFRTSDIEEVGDATHLTLFEMLGYFSFGYRPGTTEAEHSSTPYFKRVAIKLAYEFYFDILKVSQERVYVTVYEGDETRGIVRDDESAAIWQELGLATAKIRFAGADNFWGPTGNEGPCGPTTEIYIDGVEVGNVVFNQYYSSLEKKLTPLEYQGVDTGLGLDRMAIVLQKVGNIYETDLFRPIIMAIKSQSNIEKYDERAARIVADHLKAAIFLIADGVRPANKAQGYILRRLIRRLYLNATTLGLDQSQLLPIIEVIYQNYVVDYDRLAAEYGLTQIVLGEEIDKFNRTLEVGMREFEKVKKMHADDKVMPTETLFKLFDTYGFPIELTKELAEKDGFKVDITAFNERFKAHQETSRAGLDRVFSGGLADHEPQTVKHHTAHHLLLAALRQVLGTHVFQRGSNVTAERLRIDFSHLDKVEIEQLKMVEAIVNQAITDNLEVERQEMPRAEAEKLGALAEFGTKYSDRVTVYTIHNKDGSVLSREFCGGPHVSQTGELGLFSIIKEAASAAGVRRIKAKVS